MARNYRKISTGIQVVGQNTITPDLPGELRYNSATGKMQLYDTALRNFVSDTGIETLTNKTISGNTAVTLISGAGTLTLNTSGLVTVPNTTDTLIGKSTTDTLTNKTINAEGIGNSLTNIKDINIKADANISRSKIELGNPYRILITDSFGVISDNNILSPFNVVSTDSNGVLVGDPTLPILLGGTGQDNQTAAFNALSPATTKGDLVVHNGTDNIRVPVGANTFALVADSSQSSGVIWSAAITTPSGFLSAYAGSSTPSGWLVCNGTAIDRTVFSSLFSTIGTTWGVGDGFTTFNVPNFNGRTLVGFGNYTDPVSGSITRTLGVSAGAEKHLLLSSESGAPSHNHAGATGSPSNSLSHTHPMTTIDNTDNPATNPSGSRLPGTTASISTGTPSNTLSHTHSITTQAAVNAASSHNNMQPYAVVTWIIKI